MRSPLNSALFRLQKLIAPLSESQEFAQLLYPIRGLIRKARLVSESMGLLARFEQNLPIQLELVPIDSAWLRRLLVEAGRDAKFGTSSPSKRISFRIAQDFPDDIAWSRYQVDEELLAQAIQTIFDNAAKYSYSNTEAWTRVQTDTNDALQIIVESTGIPVTPEDSTRATERGYRSPKAKQTTGEGTGIGLWLVSHIMKAHSGSFELMPSNNLNLTSAIITVPPSI
jgi:signal transduction histidine kinase